jgi:hypothetical protein
LFGFYFLDEERKRVQLKVKEVIMNIAREETAYDEVAINKTAKKRNTETIRLRANKKSLRESIKAITLE